MADAVFVMQGFLLDMRRDPIFDGTGVIEIILRSADGQPAGGDARGRLRDNHFYPGAAGCGVVGDGIRPVVIRVAFGVIIRNEDLGGVTGLTANVDAFQGGHGQHSFKACRSGGGRRCCCGRRDIRRRRIVGWNVDDLSRVDQAWIPYLRIGCDQRAETDPVRFCDSPERVAAADGVIRPGGSHRRVIGIVGISARHVYHLPGVHPPAQPGVRRADGGNGRAAVGGESAQGVAPLDGDIGGTVVPGMGAGGGEKRRDQYDKNDKPLQNSFCVHTPLFPDEDR